jgi:hypothetical protein
MIAFCGLKCDSCPLFLATIEQNKSQQKKMRELIAEQCSKYYGMDVKPEDVSDCDGCTADTGRLFSGCMICEIRKCAISKNINSCAFCVDYACESLKKHFILDPQAQNRLEEIRQVNRM